MSSNMIVKRWLEISTNFGASSEQPQPVEFFFYASTENEASNILIDLHLLGYDVYGIYECEDKRWSIIGATPPISTDEKDITSWVDLMYALAEKHHSVFDGWGMLVLNPD
jgi:regulator of RNase E activity RraB